MVAYFKQRSVVLPIIGVTVVLYLIQLSLPSFTDALILSTGDVVSRPWTLLTAIFLHASPSHILFNMYGLFLFGTLLESRIGVRKFLYVYFGGGLMASVAAVFYYNNFVGDPTFVLGASGAVMAVIGAMIAVMPRLQLLFFFLIPTPLWVAGLIWLAIDTFGLFAPSGVANIAHIVGMATGYLYGRYLLSKQKQFYQKKGSQQEWDVQTVDDYMKHGRV